MPAGGSPRTQRIRVLTGRHYPPFHFKDLNGAILIYIHAQVRRYAAAADEKVAKFKGQTGSDV
jgi:hypothetical protein